MIEPIPHLWIGTQAEMPPAAQAPQGVIYITTDTTPRHLYANHAGSWTLIL